MLPRKEISGEARVGYQRRCGPVQLLHRFYAKAMDFDDEGHESMIEELTLMAEVTVLSLLAMLLPESPMRAARRDGRSTVHSRYVLQQAM